VRRGKETDARPRRARVGHSRWTSESVGRSIFVVTSGHGFTSGAADYPSDFCKTETESARERAYIRHRSPAPLGTQVYNRAARLWSHPIKSSSSRLKGKAPPNRAGPTGHRSSMSTPGRDLLISTPGSRTRRRSSIVTSRSRTPLPTVMSRSRWTHSLLHSGPTQSCLQIRSALAGSESAAELAITTAIAKT